MVIELLYWHEETGVERRNPKLLKEGERVKTHMVFRYKANEVLLCLESGQRNVVDSKNNGLFKFFCF